MSADEDRFVRFLNDEAWFNSWRASVSRANFYVKGHDKKEKEKEKKELKEEIEDSLKKMRDGCYQKACCEKLHLENISALLKIYEKYPVVGKTKYGSAQKLLNMYLKYLWCFGLISNPPPHCPVDRIIINETIHKNKVNWTKLTNEADYMIVIDAISKKAKEKEKGLTIAEWELANYSARKKANS